jgi:sugar O-acyltransferase (sialic acid O-acetyltransferase NeuD family)
MRFAVFGTGGFGREIAPFVREQNARLDPEIARQDDALVFVDDSAEPGTQCNGLKVLTFAELSSAEHRDRHVVVAIGDGHTREKIEARCREAGLTIGKAIAPTTRILGPNEIGDGAVLCDNVVITSNAKIGRGFQANIYSYVAHECVIGDYVTFAPRVSCNGNVHIGDYAYIGTNASFIQGKEGRPLTVGEGAIVGMGAVVTKPVEPYTVVTGNPAKLLRKLR